MGAEGTALMEPDATGEALDDFSGAESDTDVVSVGLAFGALPFPLRPEEVAPRMSASSATRTDANIWVSSWESELSVVVHAPWDDMAIE
jgi:hypothetical protein